jgi:hypothetical protein
VGIIIPNSGERHGRNRPSYYGSAAQLSIREKVSLFSSEFNRGTGE